LSAAMSVASAAKQRTPLQIGAACLVVCLVTGSVWTLKQILFDSAYPLYTPFLFMAVSVVIAVLQVWTVKREKKSA